MLAGADTPGVAFKTTWGRWQFGVVMPVLAGLRPVRIAERVGEQSGLAEYARENVIPRLASRWRFGVL